MGETAENLARRYEISREEQDEYALRSQQRAQAATETGRFENEMRRLRSKAARVKRMSLLATNTTAPGTTMQDLGKLAPVFSKNGTVTAGNSSGITDGAAALLVMGEEALKESGAEPQARIVDYEIVGVAPEIMGIGPVPAVRYIAGASKAALN